MASVTIRPADPSDAATIVRLVRELAAYEGLLDQVQATEADILRDGFGERPRFACLLAEVDGAAVGFALYFDIYSTFEGRSGIFVEDLYVAEFGARARHRPAAPGASGEARDASATAVGSTSSRCTGTRRAASTSAWASGTTRTGCTTGSATTP